MLNFFKKFTFLFYITGISILAQNQDTTISYSLKPIEVTAERTVMTQVSLDPSKDRLAGILGSNGFSLIRKGVFFAQDIYADGLKKSDISVVVDGERYHTACPNRMDSPLTRVNPIELDKVDLFKTNGSLQSSLGGVVNFHRKTPSAIPRIQAGVSSNNGAQRSVDAAFSFEGFSHMATLRFSSGTPYKDADGNSFKDLYGYSNNFNYTLAEGSFQGVQKDFRYGGSFTYTEDVSFPYLLMDERLNKVYSAHISYMNNKIYFNNTNHTMDNALRKSKMTMTTKANNLTIGAVGKFYEIFYRNWDSDNTFKQRETGNLIIANDLMPNTKKIQAAVYHKFSFGQFGLSGKLGLVNQSMNDSESQYYKVNKKNNEYFDRWFPIFGLNFDYTGIIGENIGYGLMIEAAGEAPDIEELYIYVQKPMNKPNWMGNAKLDGTFKGGMRGIIAYKTFNIEVYYSQLWNYVNLTSIMGEKPIQTYENIDAQLLGSNLSYRLKLVDLNLSYTYAQNLSNDIPLSEIRPFEGIIRLRSPQYSRINLFANISFQLEQSRVDKFLGESSTPAWFRADIGLRYELEKLEISIEVENLTNQLYYQHLSYLRNPFTSGANVFEPGRNVYFSISYSM